MSSKWFIGVDEVGRGPLAGPVAVGVVLVPVDFEWELIPGVTDSKKLSPKARDTIFTRTQALKAQGVLDYAIGSTSASVIDRIGIVSAINLAMTRALRRLTDGHGPIEVRAQTTGQVNDFGEIIVKLDGGLRAPKHFAHQQTIIKGDAREPVIGLASILAKVTRDRYMVRLHKNDSYTPYDFARHKGYGTKFHRQTIERYGCTDMHRKSYCKNIREA